MPQFWLASLTPLDASNIFPETELMRNVAVVYQHNTRRHEVCGQDIYFETVYRNFWSKELYVVFEAFVQLRFLYSDLPIIYSLQDAYSLTSNLAKSRTRASLAIVIGNIHSATRLGRLRNLLRCALRSVTWRI